MAALTFEWKRPILVGAVVALVVAGCAGAASTDAWKSGDGSGRDSTIGSTSGVGSLGGGAIGAQPEAVPPDDGGPMAAPSAVPEAYGGGTDATGGSGTARSDDARVVKTGTLSIEVDTLDETLKKARTAIVSMGGYVAGSDESNDGDRTQATISYRIPAARWDDALDALRGLAVKVVGEQTNAVEVTGQVLDLVARITNLEATEASLQAIMTKAVKISDVLEVQRELTLVREQIEQLTTQKVHLEDQADFGTLSVSFAVPVPAVVETSQGWDPAAEVDRAIASLMGMLQGLASIGIWLLIVGLPVMLVLGVGAAFVLLALRRSGLGRRPGSGGMPPVVPPLVPPASPAAPEA